MTRETRLDRRTLLRGTGVTILASGLAGCGEPSEEEDEEGGDGGEEEEEDEQLQGAESA